ncbi:hypothetical protein NC652_028161 [Populus alba x Populus x berolinensis]|nr:hypothetical protein NC652_028161 [Populus alba x Populus x berolinensis]
MALRGREEFWVLRDSLTRWVHLLLDRLAVYSSLQNRGAAGHRVGTFFSISRFALKVSQRITD